MRSTKSKMDKPVSDHYKYRIIGVFDMADRDYLYNIIRPQHLPNYLLTRSHKPVPNRSSSSEGCSINRHCGVLLFWKPCHGYLCSQLAMRSNATSVNQICQFVVRNLAYPSSRSVDAALTLVSAHDSNKYLSSIKS